MKDFERALQTFHSLRVKQIMPSIPNMPIVDKNTPLIDIFKILRTRHHVWVVNNKRDMKPIGFIRYRNIIDFLLPPGSHMARFGKTSDVFRSILGGAETAKDIMDKNFLTIDENATVLEALEKMKKYKVQILAITKDRRLVGEISLRVLVSELLRLMRVGGAEWSRSMRSSQSG